MPKGKYAVYEPADPYFNLVRGALGGLVDGEHFFDSCRLALQCGTLEVRRVFGHFMWDSGVPGLD
jgi:hypothetical protein